MTERLPARRSKLSREDIETQIDILEGRLRTLAVARAAVGYQHDMEWASDKFYRDQQETRRSAGQYAARRRPSASSATAGASGCRRRSRRPRRARRRALPRRIFMTSRRSVICPTGVATTRGSLAGTLRVQHLEQAHRWDAGASRIDLAHAGLWMAQCPNSSVA